MAGPWPLPASPGGETVVDLYCGIGTITLVMARQAGRAIGAEVIPAAVEDAQANARRNGVENAEFLCADAGQAAQELARRGLRPDVICVDPPRKGSPRGGGGHCPDGPPAGGVRLLRPGHPGPGCAAGCGGGLPAPAGGGGGSVPADGACGDGVSFVQTKP